MMSPRYRRLINDHAQVKEDFAGHPHLRVEPVGASPPETYRVTFRVRGLRLDGDKPVVKERHVCEIRLPRGYPAEAPFVVPITQVFHPNISVSHYCIADHWAAGQPLTDIIRKIGDMIQYRVYNVHSPLNAVAARWATENRSRLPVGTVLLGSPEVVVKLKAQQRPGGRLEIVP